MFRILLATVTFTLLATMPCARAAGPEQLETNKKTVAAFEEAALNQKDFDAASKYRWASASITSGSMIGRSDLRPEGSPIRVV